MALLRRLFITCLLLLAPLHLAWGQRVPIPPLTGPVIDQIGVLSAASRAELEQELWALKNEKGSEVVVLIVPSTKPEEIEQYSIRVVETWKLGRKGVDDGGLLLVALKDRRVRIEVGRGLEGDVPDVKAFRIIDEVIVPRFKQGEVAEGVLAGARAVVDLIRGIDLPAPKPAADSSDGLYLPVAFIGYFIGSLFETFLGLLLGAGIGGLFTFVVGSLLFSPGLALGLGVLVTVLVILVGAARTGSGRRGYWSGSSSSIGGESSSSGGSFGGGSFGSGGSFSGGGSSGRW